jgi:hypothetical protein
MERVKVWVGRPKPWWWVGAWSSRAHPVYGKGFGSGDPNLGFGFAHGHLEPIHSTGEGLGRSTQTLVLGGCMDI